MTKKRARKLMMAAGISRNQANALLDPAVRPLAIRSALYNTATHTYSVCRLPASNKSVLFESMLKMQLPAYRR